MTQPVRSSAKSPILSPFVVLQPLRNALLPRKLGERIPLRALGTGCLRVQFGAPCGIDAETTLAGMKFRPDISERDQVRLGELEDSEPLLVLFYEDEQP